MTSNNNAQAIGVLNGLIETCRDGVRGFRTAADCVSDLLVRAVLTLRIPGIERAWVELRAEVRRLGGIADGHGTVEGALHRGWINLKSAANSKDAGAVIKECERGEEHAAQRYEAALNTNLPPETRLIVARHHHGVLHNLECVRALHGDPESNSSDTIRSGDRTEPPPA